MKSRSFNESGDPTILFVMGFGNRLKGANETWFINQLTTAGYHVHAIQLPTSIADFEREYVIPVQQIVNEQKPAVVLSHSLGGLVAAFLDTAGREVYLSPWWGIFAEKVATWERWLIPKLPIKSRILPIKTHRDEIGTLLPDHAWAQLPKRISPTFITEINRAQQSLPSISNTAVVFVSLEDTVISISAVGTAVSASQIRLYDGGHQMFSSWDREHATNELLSVLV